MMVLLSLRQAFVGSMFQQEWLFFFYIEVGLENILMMGNLRKHDVIVRIH